MQLYDQFVGFRGIGEPIQSIDGFLHRDHARVMGEITKANLPDLTLTLTAVYDSSLDRNPRQVCINGKPESMAGSIEFRIADVRRDKIFELIRPGLLRVVPHELTHLPDGKRYLRAAAQIISEVSCIDKRYDQAAGIRFDYRCPGLESLNSSSNYGSTILFGIQPWPERKDSEKKPYPFHDQPFTFITADSRAFQLSEEGTQIYLPENADHSLIAAISLLTSERAIRYILAQPLKTENDKPKDPGYTAAIKELADRVEGVYL